jgi:tetratricopeptide (TPR) repeat protein
VQAGARWVSSRTPLYFLAALGCLLAASRPAAHAHGELHDMILQATKDIEKNPRDPLLYLKRAELHRAHLGWDAAMADIERAAALTNQWPHLHFARAGLYLDAQWFESADLAATRYLEHAPTDWQTLVIRARARAKLGRYLESSDDYTQAIKHSPDKGPELFLERAQAFEAAGATHLDQALRGLEEGLTELGPIVTLQLAAIDIEVKRQRVDAALARLDKLMATAPRKETWLLRRGDILRQAGRKQEAAASYKAALQSLENLPSVRRRVPAMAELERRIQAALAEVSPSATEAGPAPR